MIFIFQSDYQYLEPVLYGNINHYSVIFSG